MNYRFRAKLHFTDTGQSQGMAQWCDDQAAQRVTMAFHINEGRPNQESSFHQVEENGYVWNANFFVSDGNQSILEDLFNQIDSIWHYVATPQSETDPVSFMDVHKCHNDEQLPCEKPYMMKWETL